jgi:hypothetical protein
LSAEIWRSMAIASDTADARFSLDKTIGMAAPTDEALAGSGTAAAADRAD